jgi:flagellar assembly factor FliW
MAITIESSRFGRVEIDPDKVVEFPEGLVGLEGSRYALLATDASSPFLWLQSLDDPQLALPVTDPQRFFADFSMEMADEDAERLGVDASTPVAVYVTVRAAAALEDFTANLRAPILIWEGRGYQVINHAPGRELRAPLFAGVEVEAGPTESQAC